MFFMHRELIPYFFFSSLSYYEISLCSFSFFNCIKKKRVRGDGSPGEKQIVKQESMSSKHTLELELQKLQW